VIVGGGVADFPLDISCAAKTGCCSKKKITLAVTLIRKNTMAQLSPPARVCLQSDHGDQLAAEMA